MFDFAKRKICANQLTSIMKGIAALAPTLLLTLILTSCMSDGYTDTAAGKSDTYINLNVSTPTAQARVNAPANTAGTSGTLGQNETSPNPTEEEKIYSIRVWAFKSGSAETAAPIGFKAETGLNETGSHQVSMKLLRKAAGDLENIDLFILLNAESIGVLNNNNCNRMTRKELKNAVSLPDLRAKKKWSFETALTNGTLTGLVAASAALSAMLFFTLMFVMTREIGKPVAGTVVA